VNGRFLIVHEGRETGIGPGPLPNWVGKSLAGLESMYWPLLVYAKSTSAPLPPENSDTMTNASRLPSTVLGMGLCSLLMIFVSPSLSSQEVEGKGKGTGALFSPADYLEISSPLTARVGANVYGFYLGNVQAGIALVEVPTKLSSHFAVTPSYLFIKVPANGLALLIQEPQTAGYRENQFRLAATLFTSWRHFNLAERNMYARRLTPTGDVDRYRNKVFVGRELAVGTYRCSPFVFDEIYHDFASGNWLRRNWVVAGVDLPASRHLTFQASHIRQDDQYLRSVNFLGLAVLVRTGKPFGRNEWCKWAPSHRGLVRSSFAIVGEKSNASKGELK